METEARSVIRKLTSQLEMLICTNNLVVVAELKPTSSQPDLFPIPFRRLESTTRAGFLIPFTSSLASDSISIPAPLFLLRLTFSWFLLLIE